MGDQETAGACYLITYTDSSAFSVVTTPSYSMFYSAERIDCGYNENLFLAIAALRDDTDKDQWFVVDRKMQGYEVGDFFISRFDRQHPSISHKATTDELIKYFNK